MAVSGLQDNIRKNLGYYDWNDVAQCACQIVGKFGISGARGVLNNINKVLRYIHSVREGLEMLSGFVNKVQSFGEYVFGLDFSKNQIMKQLANINVCPMIDELVWREMDSIGFGVDIAVNNWFADKLEVLNKYGTKAQEEIRDAEKFLSALSQMIMLVEDCAVEVVGSSGKSGGGLSSSKTLENSLKGDVVSQGVNINVDRKEYYTEKERATGLYKIDDEYWIAYVDKFKVVSVMFKKNGQWGSVPIDVNDLPPSLYIDGNKVYVFYVLSGLIHIHSFDRDNSYNWGLKRIVYYGKVIDVVAVVYKRMFWLNEIDGVWRVMTLDLEHDGNIQEVFNTGVSTDKYGGIDISGSDLSVWNIFYSLNDTVYLLKVNLNNMNIVGFIEIGEGSRPYIFRNDELEMYGLLCYDKVKGWGVRFSSDLVNWTGLACINRMVKELKDSFISITKNVSLTEFFDMLQETIDIGVGL
jgi:hypothetical protein